MALIYAKPVMTDEDFLRPTPHRQGGRCQETRGSLCRRWKRRTVSCDPSLPSQNRVQNRLGRATVPAQRVGTRWLAGGQQTACAETTQRGAVGGTAGRAGERVCGTGRSGLGAQDDPQSCAASQRRVRRRRLLLDKERRTRPPASVAQQRCGATKGSRDVSAPRSVSSGEPRIDGSVASQERLCAAGN